MSYEADYGVFIGRFQCLHAGHQRVIDTALEKCEKLIVLVGSAHAGRSLRNPWTWQERADMIRACYPDESRVIIRPLRDYTYRNTEWLKAVQNIVADAVEYDHPQWSDKPPRIALIGSKKDNSGYYLDMFPMWKSIPVEHKIPLNATDIRMAMFGVDSKYMPSDVKEWIDPRVWALANPDRPEPWFFDLRDELAWIRKTHSIYDNLPFGIIFQTVDACVIQSGQVLVIERKKRPGKGLLALPGGYLNRDETIEDGIERELMEETRLDVHPNELRAARKDIRVFDEPNRSDRGRIITHCGLYVLPDARTLPKVKARDDAKKAFWLPLSEVKSEYFFEDHFHLIAATTASI